MNQVEVLYLSLVNSQMLLTESDERFFEQYHLGRTRYYALFHIAQEPGISLSQLSQRLLCTKGNTTRIMKSLEQEGQLTRQMDPEDHRALRLSLTERGERLLVEAMEAYHGYKKRLFSCLNDVEIETLIHNLGILDAHIESLFVNGKELGD
jgi:DNA-binding MarR family transcriptional regulator